MEIIKGGGGHVLVLNKTGHLFACGWNHKGQLGTGDQRDLSSFVQIQAKHFSNKTVSKIACGWDSSAAICDGTLYVWGSNAFGQLGFDKKTVPLTSTPIELKLPANEKVEDVCFGLRYICILSTQKNVYLAGRVKFSDQCDIVEHNGVEFCKLKIDSKGLCSISSGSNHLIYCCGRRVVGIGDNKYQQCEENHFSKEVVQIECGWTHNGVLTADGKVWLWGRNTYGQLGSSDTNSTNLVELQPERIENICLGSEHGLALTEDGVVYTWGWNEHGNCGNGQVDNV